MEEGAGLAHLGTHRLGTHDLAGLLRTGFILAVEFGTGTLPDAYEETGSERLSDFAKATQLVTWDLSSGLANERVSRG